MSRSYRCVDMTAEADSAHASIYKGNIQQTMI